jgi:hypothetical protein
LGFRDVLVLHLLLSLELTVLPLIPVKERFDPIPREPERRFVLWAGKLVLDLGKQERGSSPVPETGQG